MTESDLAGLRRDLHRLTEQFQELSARDRNDKTKFDAIERWIAVREERDKYIAQRFDRVEKRLDGIASLGKWVLGAIGSSFVAALVGFIVAGGLHGG